MEDYKDALLKMALADGRPLSLGDSVGFRQFAAELSLPYVSRNALNLHFKNRGWGVDWMLFFRPLRSQSARLCARRGAIFSPLSPNTPTAVPCNAPLSPRAAATAASYYPVIPAPPLLGPHMDKRSILSLSLSLGRFYSDYPK